MTIEEGRRFRLNYLQSDGMMQDSARFRRRLFRAMSSYDVKEFPLVFERRTGASLPRSATGYYSWELFFTSGDIADVLDSITVFADWLRERSRTPSARSWLGEVANILSEERIGYRLDERGGVHFAVDHEFEALRSAALNGLGAARYSAAREEFEAAYRALDGATPDAPEAIRRLFVALEVVFKLMFGSRVSRLGEAEINKHLRLAAIDAETGEAARAAAKLQTMAFADWVNAAHNYRHAKGVETPEPTSTALTVSLVSAGAGFLRWLIALDAASRPAE